MMPIDPALLGIIMFVVGMAWWIAIGVRKSDARAIEVIAIIALVVGGMGMFLVTTFQMLFAGWR
jgi:hypothetical protein